MENNKTIQEKLVEIQATLKAPKELRNNFGNYNYRSAETILEAVKPVLKEFGCFIKISDEIINLGDRYYVKSTATIGDGVGEVQTTAFAREEESKKGMDGAQVTGACSSYARKYALNGLLAIDDTKDADDTNTHGKETPTPKTVAPPAPKPITPAAPLDERKSKALASFKAVDFSKVLAILIKEYKLTKYTKLEDFIAGESIERILEVYTKATAK